MNKQALLERLRHELSLYLIEEAETAKQSEKSDYCNWEEEIERLEAQGKVSATEWLISVVETFEEVNA